MTQSAPPARLVRNSSLQPLALGLILVLTLAVLLLTLPACGRGDDKNAKGKRPVAVAVAVAAVKNVPVLVLAVGNVEAYASVVIKPQVSGVIAKQLVRDGQDVVRDQPLFFIDPRTYKAAMQEAQARMQKDQAQAKKAEDDLTRFQALFEQGAVSRDQLEQMQTNVGTLRASLALDRAQVEQARLQLEYATITAPIAGRVGQVLVHEGNVVGKSNDDRTLVVINQIEPIFVSFSVPERHLPEIQKQAALGPLRVEAQTAEGVVLDTGQLASIDNAVDKATGTIRLKAVFANKGRALWPGQFVRAFLRLAERESAVVIPAQAVQTGVSGPYVFVVKDDLSVDMRPVTISPAPDQAVVVDTGVAPGEKVVVDGQVMLVPGAKVELKAAPAAQANASANATAGQTSTPAQAAPAPAATSAGAKP